MEKNSNWIKLNRSILDWEWFQDANTLQVFVFLLLKANHKDGRWQGIEVKRGQHITSLDKIANGCGLSIRQVRTCLSKLEKTQEIDKQSDKHFTLITICKYDTYQDEDEKSDKQVDNQMTINRQSNDNQMTTNKNNKEGKEEKELYANAMLSKSSSTLSQNSGQDEKDFFEKDDENENKKENTSLEKNNLSKKKFTFEEFKNRVYEKINVSSSVLDENEKVQNYLTVLYEKLKNNNFISENTNKKISLEEASNSFALYLNQYGFQKKPETNDIYRLLKDNVSGITLKINYYQLDGYVRKYLSSKPSATIENIYDSYVKKFIQENIDSNPTLMVKGYENFIQNLKTPPTPPPFTQEELLNNPKIINQPQMVKDALITRYVNASKTNFVSKNGNKMDLAMFTGFILDNIIEELGLVKKNNYGHNLPTDYSKLTDEDIFGY